MEVLFLIGRILYGGFFLMNGINHFGKHEMMAGYSAAKGVPAAKLAVLGSGAMLLLGGASLILGYYPVIGGALILLFLLSVSPVMHNFWVHTDPAARMNDQINFTKNLALAGAALVFMSYPHPWPLSLGG
jgi:putative oxidoreductase